MPERESDIASAGQAKYALHPGGSGRSGYSVLPPKVGGTGLMSAHVLPSMVLNRQVILLCQRRFRRHDLDPCFSALPRSPSPAFRSQISLISFVLARYLPCIESGNGQPSWVPYEGALHESNLPLALHRICYSRSPALLNACN
jgi:hypothetical protein